MQLDRQFPGWEQRDPLVLWFPMFFHHFSGIVQFLVRKVNLFNMIQVKRQMGCSGKHINYCRISSIPKNETESSLLPYHSNLNYFLGKTLLFAKSLTGHYLKVMFSPRENNDFLEILTNSWFPWKIENHGKTTRIYMFFWSGGICRHAWLLPKNVHFLTRKVKISWFSMELRKSNKWH